MNLFNFSFGKLVSDSIADAFYSILLSLNGLLYNIIEALYKVFCAVSKVNLFSDSAFQKITSRMYVVMGIAMLFIFAYNLILMIVNPEDKKTTGQMTKVVKETVISLILIVLLPTIFKYMNILQFDILDTNIIGKIILNDTGSTTDSCNYDQMTILDDADIAIEGNSKPSQDLNDYCEVFYDDSKHNAADRGAYSIAPTLFSAFYHPTEYGLAECTEYIETCKSGDCDSYSGVITENEDKTLCKYYYYDVKKATFTGDIKPFNEDSKFYTKLKNNEGKFEFNWVLSIASAILAIVMFASYAIAVGVRVAKLGFLQIISPITVMMRIIPSQKDAIYGKWFKNLKNTYLDVFIRLAIIYFALFAISLIPEIWDSFHIDNSYGTFVQALAKVIVILGILQFAKDAPALIKEFVGNSGNFSIKKPFTDLKTNPGINTLRGAMYGATTGSGWGRIAGLFSGGVRGAVSGYDKAVKGIDTARTERADGSTFWGRNLDRARVAVGMETRGESLDRNLEKKFHTKERTEMNQNVKKEMDNIRSAVNSKLEKEDSKTNLSFTVDQYDTAGNVIGQKTYSGLNYANFVKLRDSLQKEVENATSEDEKIRAQKKLQDFSKGLEDAKTKEMRRAVTDAINNNNHGGLLNKADLETIQSSVRTINSYIDEGGVAVEYDENGQRRNDTEFTTNITNGDQLFNTSDDSSLQNRLTAQRQNISERSSSIKDGNYNRYQANSRMVRGQGKSEKK